ncbi:MAG: MlaD family protein [Phycisphaerae bacterium]
MAKKQRDAFRAGVFMLLSIMLILVLIVAIKGFARVFEPVQVRAARFSLRDDLGGLQVGDNLRVAGFTVGEIQSIRLITNVKKPFVRVTFTMPKKYTLRTGAQVVIGGTITGTSWLNFESLGSGKPLPPDYVLTGRPSGISHALATVASLAPQIKAMVTQVRTTTVPLINADLTKFGATADSIRTAATSASGVLQSVHGEIKPVVAKYNAAADKTAYAMDQAGKLLHSGRKGAIVNINALTADIKKAIPALLAKAQSDLNQVHATFTNSTALTQQAKSLLTQNQDRINSIIRALHGASVNLKIFAVEIRHSPWRLLYKPSKKDINNVEIYDAVREFDQAARHLQHAADVLKASAVNPQNPAQQAQLHQLMRKLNTTFNQFQQVETKFWKAVKQ